MKVLQIVPELNAGGVERTTLEMAESLIKSGHSAHICSAGGRLEPEFEKLGAVLHQSDIGSKNPLRLRANTKTLIDIIKSEGIDIVHVRSRAPAWPAHAAAKATSRPFLTTYHGIYNAGYGFKRRYNAIMARGDLIIANSNFTKAHIIEEHGTDPEIIRVIPRGVDMAVFDPDNVSKKSIQQMRQAWNIESNENVILLPGRLTRWKGQIDAIKALAKLPENHKLVLLGDPQGRESYVKELRDLANEYGIDNRIVIPGHTSEMAAAYSASDIVIVPSTDPEAFGRVVAEAQAMGCPVIASAHGGPMETVIDGKTGLLFQPGDIAALKDAIETIEAWSSYDPDFARKHVAGNFSKKQLQDKTLAVYNELLR